MYIVHISSYIKDIHMVTMEHSTWSFLLSETQWKTAYSTYSTWHLASNRFPRYQWPGKSMVRKVHSLNLWWNSKNAKFHRKIVFQTPLFGFHVKFWGCKNASTWPTNMAQMFHWFQSRWSTFHDDFSMGKHIIPKRRRLGVQLRLFSWLYNQGNNDISTATMVIWLWVKTLVP